MHDPQLTLTAVLHVVVGRLRSSGAFGPNAPAERDRGAVSLEQALWYAAAAVAVAAVATVIWAQIRQAAETPVIVPSAP